MSASLIMAVPKGRILQELQPLLVQCGIVPEPDFFDESSRKLQFGTNNAAMKLIRVRSFDVPTFVAFGAAHLGVAGSDVLEESDYSDVYAPLDLRIGICRLSLARKQGTQALASVSHMRIATKYPRITQRFFSQRGIQAECIKLSGAMELAPELGLAEHIVDLVSSGATLKANGLEEVEALMHVSSRLIVNRTAFKTRNAEMSDWIERFREPRV